MLILQALEGLRLETRSAFIALSLVLAAVGFIPYIAAVWRDRHRTDPKAVKPAKASWIIWFTLTLLVALGMLQANTLSAQIVVYVIGDIPVLGLALLYGIPGWSKLDKFCIAAGVIGILLWSVTVALVAILIGITVTMIGSWPTYQKVWHKPHSEPIAAWYIATATSVFGTLAVADWTLEHVAAPIGYLIIQSAMLLLIVMRRRIVPPQVQVPA